MVKTNFKPRTSFLSVKRPKKATKGFGRTCKSCGKRFGTITRLKDHEKMCRNTGFRHGEVVVFDGHHKCRRPKRTAKMIWIPIRSTMRGKDVELWAGIHPVTKNKVYSLKDWPEKSKIEGYFRVTRVMFDTEGRTKDRWKTAVEWV
jgi:hypothetical protein